MPNTITEADRITKSMNMSMVPMGIWGNFSSSRYDKISVPPVVLPRIKISASPAPINSPPKIELSIRSPVYWGK